MTPMIARALDLIFNFWNKEYGTPLQECRKAMLEDGNYVGILYTEDDKGDDIFIDIDLDERFARFTKVYRSGKYSGDILIHDEYYANEIAMVNDLQTLDFVSWYSYAEDILVQDEKCMEA